MPFATHHLAAVAVACAVLLRAPVALAARPFIVFEDEADGAAPARCFIVNQPMDTQMTLGYEWPLAAEVYASMSIDAARPKSGEDGSAEAADGTLRPVSAAMREQAILVTVRDRKLGKQVLSATIDNEKGQLAFSTTSDGTHELCLVPKRLPLADAGGPMRFGMTLKVGQGAAYYEDLATKEHMDKLQLDVVKLNDRLAQALAEADYMKQREMDFHLHSEAMGKAAAVWPMLQLVVLLVTTVAQVGYLHRFFADKKLV